MRYNILSTDILGAVSVIEYQMYQLCIRQECCYGAFGIEKFKWRKKVRKIIRKIKESLIWENTNRLLR